MSSIFRIISFTKKFWKWYCFMGLFVISLSLLSLAVPLLSKQVVDLIVSQLGGKHIEFSAFFIFLLAIIGVDILISFMTSFSQWIGDILAVKLQSYLSSKFYGHVLSLHMGYFDNEITGKIVNKLYRGITSITDFIQNMLNNFLPFFMTAIVTILLLAWYSPIIAFFLFILFPTYVLITHNSTKAWMKLEENKNSLNDFSQGRVFESISGIRVVKSFASEILELSSFLKTRKEIEDITITQTRKWHLYDLARRLCLNIILFAIYAYIVYYTFAKRYTLGEMTLLLQLVTQARWPLFAMSFILGQIQEAGAGSEDFFKILKIKSELGDIPGAGDLKVMKDWDGNKPLIKFSKVNFFYEQNKIVLKDINFKVLKNEKVALVGASGEGKSTIVNLLLRFYEPQNGNITVGDHNIREVTLKSLHENIAVVFQESLLFSGTVLENIKYGKQDSSFEEIVEAAKAANAHEFILKLPNRYESLVGERGVKLSGGQKQRIAIARAILKNAPIIILDEATSSLDSKSELQVQKGLDRLLSGRTSIIIAHRLSTISSADHILVLRAGKIAEYGTSGELMSKKDGIYRELMELQKKLLTATTEENTKALEKFDIVG